MRVKASLRRAESRLSYRINGIGQESKRRHSMKEKRKIERERERRRGKIIDGERMMIREKH